MTGPLLALLVSAAAAGSDDLPFERLPARCRADLLVDVTLDRDSDLDAVLAAAEVAGLPLQLMVRPAQVEGWGEDLEALAASGTELGLWLPWPRQASQPRADAPSPAWARLRQERREIKRSVGAAPRTVGASSLPASLEGVLEAFGFTLLLPAPDGLSRPPRYAIPIGGGASAGVVLWPVQPLEADAERGPEGSLVALLDRTTSELEVGTGPVVRLALPARAFTTHPALLARWSREVLEPCGVAALGRRAAEASIRSWLRAGGGELIDDRETSADALGPTVVLSAQELDAISRTLSCADGGSTLVRPAPEAPSLAESWLALALTVDGREPPLDLHPVLPPQSSPRSTLPAAGIHIPRATLQAAIGDLIPAAEQQIPAFARVGEHGLTAAELLCALAGAVQGQDPVHVTRTYSPEPFAPGLGWD